jgi:hypothetical protein
MERKGDSQVAGDIVGSATLGGSATYEYGSCPTVRQARHPLTSLFCTLHAATSPRPLGLGLLARAIGMPPRRGLHCPCRARSRYRPPYGPWRRCQRWSPSVHRQGLAIAASLAMSRSGSMRATAGRCERAPFRLAAYLDPRSRWFGKVRISAPSLVIAIVCSLCAVRQPVALRRVQPSASVTSLVVFAMTHGSNASSSPGRSL